MKCPNFLIVIGAELITSSSSTPALCALELQAKVREDFTITYYRISHTSTYTFKALLRHYAKQVLTHGVNRHDIGRLTQRS